MGLYYQDCQKSVYKANFKPSEVACPITWNFVELTQEVRDKIGASTKPQLSDKEPAYTVANKDAKGKGMRA